MNITLFILHEAARNVDFEAIRFEEKSAVFRVWIKRIREELYMASINPCCLGEHLRRT
mgnify:FL=1